MIWPLLLGGVRRSAGEPRSRPRAPSASLAWECTLIQAGTQEQHVCRPPGSGQMLLVCPPDEHRRAWMWIRRIDAAEEAGYLDHGLVGLGTPEPLKEAKRHAELSYRRDARVFAVPVRDDLSTHGGT